MIFIEPSTKNKIFDGNNITEYLSEYRAALNHALSLVSSEELDKTFQLLLDARENDRKIWVAGNGGSAAISDHLCCDFTKGTRFSARKSLKTSSLSSNVSLLTALANDFSYEEIFAQQLEMLATKNDLVILISSSGNSPNVVKAAEWAKINSLTTISMTGFTGGKLANICDVNLHVPIENYGVVEDAHQVLMHTLAQFITKFNLSNNKSL
ncbi:D-sedoheptulose-7-phosphate isomerase [Pigmentibacter ruber]